jgi:hypothetical protein
LSDSKRRRKPNKSETRTCKQAVMNGKWEPDGKSARPQKRHFQTRARLRSVTPFLLLDAERNREIATVPTTNTTPESYSLTFHAFMKFFLTRSWDTLTFGLVTARKTKTDKVSAIRLDTPRL